jgi:hypothetical protein
MPKRMSLAVFEWQQKESLEALLRILKVTNASRELPTLSSFTDYVTHILVYF